MTHDELLDKIYWHWRKDPRGDGLQTISDYRRVILAVVELHKPIEDNRCEACYREEYFGGRHLEVGKYPCQTIQAIEKELG